MFNQDFYPTPENVIDQMLHGVDISNKIILEPSAGKGNIVDYLLNNGAKEVIACEINKDLKKILQTKCKVIAEDFLTLASEQVSHIDIIVMNPPFSADEIHILHAFNIAPPGCKVISLCNLNTVKNTWNRRRQELTSIIEENGSWLDLGSVFSDAERSTEVEIALITLQKPGESKSNEFEGFFLDEDPAEEQGNGIMSYNVVRDLVNRYVAAVKLYDEQLTTGLKMNSLLNGFYGESLTFTCTEKGQPKLRNDFKKDLQKAGWKFIFDKMNMQKYATRGLREDINKFVEQQTQIPFTMKNIYKMLEIVVGTQSSRMDKAILDAFEAVTKHHDENRYGVEGWKTNSHYLLTETFILPYMVDFDTRWPKDHVSIHYNGNSEIVEDMVKALCYISGMNYEDTTTLRDFCDYRRKMSFGQWYSWGFFEIKGFKKGTMHFKFQNKDLWGKFNQHVSRLKGYPLFEPKKQTAYQDRQTGRAQQEKSKAYTKSNDLFTDLAA